ncbi:hypothetical protein GCM10007860_28590 [Chitiniphilus shinanonensis]|uniref:DUF2237 domain-containing protein n=1 Tax=Chitiniphilus shinanonensis TaxID=553088 RepID=A0ABQ6BWC9_9NEIS|nr:DUF2237 domain-containing protein [Chitiniphilus shinanonensis]GLS05702.1 hypothetical protein GCM10007860_28590 [Chitiniphilus shinanonensis]
MDEIVQLSVLGLPLFPCNFDPLTGYERTGFCAECQGDAGQHTVCAQMTEEFLAFSAERGNDLSTPRPDWGFPGLRPGDHWCVCAGRWIEALLEGKAPPILLAATHEAILEHLSLETLVEHALDRP